MEDDYRSSKRKMSWNPNQQQSGSIASSSSLGVVAATSSSSSSSSTLSSRPRVQSSGLVSHPSQDQEGRSPKGDRLRLPPLSSLISSSDASRSSPSPRSPSHAAFYPNQEWSPSKFQASTSIDTQSSHYSHHSSHHDSLAKQDVKQDRQSGLPSLQRSNSSSTSGTSTSAMNLPPLTTLSIRPASQSPSEVPPTFIMDRDYPAPRLPSTIQSTSSRHRPYPVSASHTERNIGPTRRRWTGESANVLPYDRPSPSSDVEYFNHLWDIYSYACRMNDDAAGMMRHTYPTIPHSDVKMLVYYLNRELDRLDQYNPRLSLQLAQDAGLANQANRTARYSPLPSPSTSSFTTSHQQQNHLQSWKSIPRRISPTRDQLYHPSDHRDHRFAPRRGSHGESHSSNGSINPSPMIQSYRSLQASPRIMHQPHPEQYTSSHHSFHHPSQYGQQYVSDGPPPPFSTFGLPPSASSSSSLPPKRVRKRKDEAEQSCLSCSATETPEWRKGPTGPRTLCNACGLLFAKQCRKKELDAQARGERPKGSRSMANEIMTMEEKERSLAELRIAVNARATNGSPPI